MNNLELLLERYPSLACCRDSIDAAFDLLLRTYRGGGKVLVCGNGGSAADSEHIVGELMKGFLLKRPIPSEMRKALLAVSADHGEYLSRHLQGALPAISLVSHSALSTAFSNDVAQDMVFAQQVYGYTAKGDTVIGLSTSGNSKNVLLAMATAKALGASTIAMTGQSGGALNTVCDITIRAPSSSTPEIQEFHLPIYHALCADIEAALFPQ